MISNYVVISPIWGGDFSRPHISITSHSFSQQCSLNKLFRVSLSFPFPSLLVSNHCNQVLRLHCSIQTTLASNSRTSFILRNPVVNNHCSSCLPSQQSLKQLIDASCLDCFLLLESRADVFPGADYPDFFLPVVPA